MALVEPVIVPEQRELERRVAQQSVVADLGQRALAGEPLGRLLDGAATAVAAGLETELSTILELMPGGERMLLRAGFGWPPDVVGAKTVPVAPGGRAGFLMLAGEPIIIEDLRTETRFKAPLLEFGGVISGMGVRIGDVDHPFGVLGAHSRSRRDFTAHDTDFLVAVANVIAAAVERDRAETEMRHQALHDPLTGLPNRTLLLDRIGHALTRCLRRDTRVAILFCDLDNFKVINDSLGHASGDTLLRALAPRLRRAMRPADTVARFGGDEFVILCEDIDDERHAEGITERIATQFEPPFSLDGAEHVLGASIGVVVSAGGPGVNAESLLRDADAAMYRAKERGRGRFELFDASMRQRALERMQIEGELRRAIERGELTLHYQPLCALADGRVTGVEALVRWQHPERGLLAPAEFLGVAEESGLIHPLGAWVLREAAHEIERWRAVWPGAEGLLLAVNLSARELSRPDLGQTIADVLAESGVAPGRLALEITETGLLDEGGAAPETLRGLKALGVALILDDFGTGWSSLTHLKRLPIDALKVDRSFVAGVGSGDNGDETIVAAILGMASGLGLAVIPEGIEHAAQRARLSELGCQLGQGFHFARPMAGAEALAFVRERAAA